MAGPIQVGRDGGAVSDRMISERERGVGVENRQNPPRLADHEGGERAVAAHHPAHVGALQHRLDQTGRPDRVMRRQRQAFLDRPADEFIAFESRFRR